MDASICCGLVVDLPYNKLYSKSTTNRTSRVWAKRIKNRQLRCYTKSKLR